jgi:phytoene synthase
LGFTTDDRRIVERVYAFCRITDDIVDEAGQRSPDEIKARLDDWLETARRAYQGDRSGTDWLDELMLESARRKVPFEVVETLVEGVRTDATLEEIRSIEALNAYCYGVASVVGVWLCYLFGITNPWFIERAESLGRGMQITNILRDVGEDLRRGRLYLPQDLMRVHGISRAQLERIDPTTGIPDEYKNLIRDLIDRADKDYEAAWEAIPALPSSFARASAVAAEVYRAIHRKVTSNGYNNLTLRARTGNAQKVLLMVKAMLRLASARLTSNRNYPELNAMISPLIMLLVLGHL